jgi:hypothetical protein
VGVFLALSTDSLPVGIEGELTCGTIRPMDTFFKRKCLDALKSCQDEIGVRNYDEAVDLKEWEADSILKDIQAKRSTFGDEWVDRTVTYLEPILQAFKAFSSSLEDAIPSIASKLRDALGVFHLGIKAS